MTLTAPRLQVDKANDQCASVGGAGIGCPLESIAQKRTPLPIKQVFVVCLMCFSEPISLFVIFPFVNQMIEELGVTSDPKELGYYSGFVEGIFSFTQFFTVFFWGSLSDRIGRRPVLISGLCGVVGSTIMFGLSKSFTMMLVSRALSGVLNGNSAVIKSVLGEITDETNQGAAFAYLSLCWSLGALIAPAIGGFLSHPAENYPSIFGFELFRQFPYLLPCLVGSVFSILGLVAGFLFLEETVPKDTTSEEHRPLLDSKHQIYSQSYLTSNTQPDTNTSPSPGAHGPTSGGAREHVPSLGELIQNSYIRKILVGYGFMAYSNVAVSALTTLWLYVPVKVGGMGFSSAEIGTALLLSGVVGNAIATIVFPPLEQRLGMMYLYRFSMFVQVLNFLIFPVAHVFAIAGGKGGAYLGAATMLTVRNIGGMAFVCNMLLIARSAPSKRSQGAINGLAQMVASAARGVGPAMATSLFAFSVKSDILGGNLVWLVFSLLALWGVVAAYQIPNGRPLDTESQIPR